MPGTGTGTNETNISEFIAVFIFNQKYKAVPINCVLSKFTAQLTSHGSSRTLAVPAYWLNRKGHAATTFI
jgi:hypothetical protein